MTSQIIPLPFVHFELGKGANEGKKLQKKWISREQKGLFR